MTTPILKLVTPDAQPDDLTPIDGIAPRRPPRDVVERLRAKVCPPDRAFDRFLPYDLRIVSTRYWTPLAVALRAAEWFDEFGVRTVVDIGSGVGKFCVAAAVAGHCQFTGIEQRPRLVAAARVVARLFECDDRVRFVEAEFGDIQVPQADAYYLYNPFGENLFGYPEQLDGDVELGDDRYARDLAATSELLWTAPVGTYLLTYNGFGGPVPAAYRQLRSDHNLPNTLRLWRKGEGPSEPAPKECA